ncbi:GNAT family N-acetyltransferase [Cupriavidus taiwanensis]|uniref:GNAT family N-acetyltransferase n=1 Tax=Cupriavidus taiwanensis TaxID=164546 RepID=UPI0015743ED4|nr:GNAT family N-acetyltransferase [Cupriavidus taiwanensis]
MKDTVHFKWLSDLADAEAHLIAELVECTALDGAMLGYARRMSDDEAEGFIAELRYRISKGHSLALVGVDKGKPVFFCMMTRSAMPNCRHRAELSKGVVHPAYRGQHIIPQAFRKIVLKAESLGIEQLILDVRAGSRAHLLWQRFGFKSYGLLDDYARVGNEVYRGDFLAQPVCALRKHVFQDKPSKDRIGMIKRENFKEELRHVLHRNLTLGHPIFEELFDPMKPNLHLLRATALQGYQLTKNFLSYVEHLFFHCPLPKFKRALLINMYEEETGRLSRIDNHVVLMQNFLHAIGISDFERDAELPLPATSALINYRFDAVRDPAKYHIGAAAVMIASEGQNLETKAGEARHELFGRVYGLAEGDLRFFSVHQAEDVGHVEQGLNLVSELCTTARMQEEALFAVDHTCKLFYAMYENIYVENCRRAPGPIVLGGGR